MKITYGTKGLLDWSISFPLGRGTVKVQFTGGAFTKYGIIPAVYSTSCAVIQKLIEESRLYKSGRIYKIKEEKTK